ncbi:HFL100Wp [Eremothecium sinecaudum]|uniref:HFL100Wp n=1 Tax=Eremothecium sinecaudum TaxID=45286 RepID=A0A0X8HUI6_9SACH|nr:HFL100Wp [Eremothecium sinecaudum]AMD21756.1 HFL100Wp [Eremothecium sinecaudum]
MTNFKSTYERKSFSKQEWNEVVVASALPYDTLKTNIGEEKVVEPSIPYLLLNYFVVMAYEESSMRMARELNIVRNTKEANEFNKVYMIKERAHARELIKRGKILEAMEEINKKFGVETLENIDSGIGSGRGKALQGEDLHFKLLLLSLIELIRRHHQNPPQSEEESNQFILDLIQYTQEKLAMKAISHKEYMKELELVMTLLLFPMEAVKDQDGNSIKVPKSLRRLYSLSLRSKIAELVNRKLLQKIHPQIALACAKGGYPDLLGCNVADKNLAHFNDLLKSRAKEDISLNLTKDSLAGMKDIPEGSLGKNTWNENSWASTSRMLQEQNLKQNINPLEDRPQMEYQVKLVQVMKLWAWCENQLHGNDIGVPRVESNS